MRFHTRTTAAVSALAIALLASCTFSTPRLRASAQAPIDAAAPYAPGVLVDSALRDTLTWLRNEWTIPGAALATFTCDSRAVAWDGVIRIDEDTPLGPHALFPMEHHTASMLATAALRLERRGVLRLDAPLRELWPSAAIDAPWYAHVNLAMLLYTPPIPAFAAGDSASRIPVFTARGRQSAASRATRWFLSQQSDCGRRLFAEASMAPISRGGTFSMVTHFAIRGMNAWPPSRNFLMLARSPFRFLTS